MRGAVQQRLAATRQRLDPRGARERRSEEALETLLDLAGRQGNADTDPAEGAPILVDQRCLDLERRRDGGGRIGEAGIRSITDALEDAATVTRRGFGHELVIADHRRRGDRPMPFRQPGRALDIGEQEGQVSCDGGGRPAAMAISIGRRRKGVGGRLT